MTTRAELLADYGWKTTSAFLPAQLDVLQEAALALRSHADSHLPGRGQAWMLRWLAPVRFHLGGLPQWLVSQAAAGRMSVVFPRRDVWLMPDFLSQPHPVQHVLHELAHVLDNLRSVRLLPATFTGGGPADRLVNAVGGFPHGLRFRNGLCGIPTVNQWPAWINSGYGNRASAEYFAETFAWSVLAPQILPAAAAAGWLKVNLFLSAV